MLDERSLLRRRDVEQLTGLSRSEIYRRLTDGTFPRPVRISSHMVRWLARDVVLWIESVAANDNSSARPRQNICKR